MGTFTVTGRDIGGLECPFDKIAVDELCRLCAISVVAEGVKIKAFRAALSGAVKAQFQGRNVRLKRAGDSPYNDRGVGYVIPVPDGYNCYSVKLGYGLSHALFLARTPGFMTVVTAETVWQELNDNRFTTPILKEWMPHLQAKLVERGLLALCYSYRCDCGTLTAGTADLDGIVSEGLREGHLRVPEPGVIDAEFRESA